MTGDTMVGRTFSAEPKRAEPEAKVPDFEGIEGSVPVEVFALLLARLGYNPPGAVLAQAVQATEKNMPDGPFLQKISYVLNALNLRGVQPALLRWDRFDQRRLPAAVFHLGRWVLVERDDAGALAASDGTGQMQGCQSTDFQGGRVLWLRVHPHEHEHSDGAFKGNLAARLVFREIFKTRRWLVDVALSTVIINVLAVTTSLFAMQVYDRVVPTLAYATLLTLVAGMGIMVSLDWLLKTLRARILDSLSCAMDKSVSQQVFDHVMRLQLDTRPRSLGTLAAQVSGLDSVKQFFTSGVIFALVDLPFAVFFLMLIGTIGGPIAFVYLLLWPVAGILGWWAQYRLRRLMREQLVRSHERQGLLVDAIQGCESIRAHNATWRFSEQWSDMTQSILNYNIQQRAVHNLATVTTGSLSTIAYVSAIVVGVGQIGGGNLTMGAMIACSILGGRVISPVAQSVQYLAQWQNVSQALQMVNRVLKLNTERRDDQHLLMPDISVVDKVGLEGVRFSYPESPVLQLNIPKLRINAGDRVALLGPIGSGKSTLLKVLAGLYCPSEGRVTLGNADLWEMDPGVVADHIGYLQQSVHLFRGTLRSNLTLAGVTGDSHLLQVVEALGIDKIAADSPRSMEHPISEGGDGLSGGQRQLIGLGRVFLAQPKVWLLDEPTASLDMESEKKVMDAIKSYVKADDILIVSTHRPALAAQLADRVIVMQGGEVIADAKPETVLPAIMGARQKKAAPALLSQQFSMPMPSKRSKGVAGKGALDVI